MSDGYEGYTNEQKERLGIIDDRFKVIHPPLGDGSANDAGNVYAERGHGHGRRDVQRGGESGSPSDFSKSVVHLLHRRSLIGLTGGGGNGTGARVLPRLIAAPPPPDGDCSARPEEEDGGSEGEINGSNGCGVSTTTVADRPQDSNFDDELWHTNGGVDVDGGKAGQRRSDQLENGDAISTSPSDDGTRPPPTKKRTNNAAEGAHEPTSPSAGLAPSAVRSIHATRRSRSRPYFYPRTHLSNLSAMRHFCEYYSVTRFRSAYLPLSMNPNSASPPRRNRLNSSSGPTYDTISTISIAFSPDGHTLASTHGDHTVKISCCYSGRILSVLKGHPRTPWTVKFHPTLSCIVASGCLGYQVRLWDTGTGPGSAVGGPPSSSARGVVGGSSSNPGTGGGGRSQQSQQSQAAWCCLSMVRLHYAIISLAFHPAGTALAIASGNSLHLWDFSHHIPFEYQRERTVSSVDGGGDEVKGVVGNSLEGEDRIAAEGATTASRTATTGGTGASARDLRRSSSGSGGEENKLSEWRHHHALRCVHFPPDGRSVIIGGVNPPTEGESTSFSLRLYQFSLPVAIVSGIASAISDGDTFINRALLYNDGGFDVSSDGRRLCACAEYWLPYGMDSVMDLLEMENKVKMDALRRDGEESSSDESSALCDGNEEVAAAVGSGEAAIESHQSSTAAPSEADSDGNLTGTSSLASSGAAAAQACSPPPRLEPSPSLTPLTPPPIPQRVNLSPPSPPGRRFVNHANPHAPGSSSYTIGPIVHVGPALPIRQASGSNGASSNSSRGGNGGRGSARYQGGDGGADRGGGAGGSLRNQHHPRRTAGAGGHHQSTSAHQQLRGGRYVPHVICVSLVEEVDQDSITTSPEASLEATSVATTNTGRIGKVLQASPLDSNTASGVTCVKFSPSSQFCLLGYGVREIFSSHNANEEEPPHQVTALYEIFNQERHPSPHQMMRRVTTLLSMEDDVNIARFHPMSGMGFVYGTKQGRVRILSPNPWVFP